MTLRNIITAILITLSLNANAQAREPSENRNETDQHPTYSIYALPPFERAICCIKFYEGIHRKKDYPYVGYGTILPICRLLKQKFSFERI